MSAVELATGYVNLVSSTGGLGKQLQKEFGGVAKNAQRQGREAGQRLIDGAGRAMKGAAVGVGLAAGAAIGAAIVGGVQSAINQQTSEKVLGGLYGSASRATKMMEDLRKVSSTSPIQYSAYTKAAEALAYAGVEGDQAVSVLQNVGHAITATGGTSEHMDRATSAVTKMVNAGKVSLDALQELSGSGTPIISGLAEHFGVSMDEINKMASEGAIGLEDVVHVMENAVGENFQKSLAGSEAASQSFGNQWKIVTDNISTAIGAELKPILEDLTPILADFGQRLVDAIPAIFGAISGVIEWLRQWGPLFLPIIAGLGTYAVVMGVVRGVTAAWQAAQILLNMALTANPIGLVIAAVAALVTAFILAYNNVEWFRDAVNAAWDGIKVAAGAVADWFMAHVWPVMQAVWDGIATGAMWLWSNVIQPVWNGIKTVVSAVIDWFSGTAAPSVQETTSGVGAVFSWLYENIIKPVWAGIQAVIDFAWNYVIKPIWDLIVWYIQNVLVTYFQVLWSVLQIVWNAISAVIKWAWNNIIMPIWDLIVWYITNILVPYFQFLWSTLQIVWNAIVAIIRWAWNSVIKPIWEAIKWYIDKVLAPVFQWLYNSVIKPVWDSIADAIGTAWNWIRDNVFDPLWTWAKETLPDAWDALVDAITKAWEAISDAAKEPVRFVVETIINDGIIKNFNKIADFFGADTVDEISLPPGFARGGWTGPGAKYKPAGVVHADEYVLRKEAQQRISRTHGRGALDYMNRFGRIPGIGYADGGMVGKGTLWDAAQWWIAQGARASRHSWFNGGRRITSGHSRNSYHYRDLAVDFNYGPGGENAIEKAFFDRLIGQFQSLFPGIRTIWRAPGHYNHLHIDTANGANMGAGSSEGGGLPFFLKPFQDLIEKVTEGVGDSAFGKLAGGAAKRLIQAPIDWITENASFVTDVAEKTIDVASRGSAMVQGRAWAAANGVSWSDLNYIVSRESSWNPRAKNPRSSAAGLPQFIAANQRHYGVYPIVEKSVSEQLGAMHRYVHDRYGGWSGAVAYWKRNNHYDTGGLVAPTLFDKGGMLAPGTHLVANKTGRPEYILPARVTDALMNGAGTGSTTVYEIHGAGTEELMRKLETKQKRRELLTVI